MKTTRSTSFVIAAFGFAALCSGHGFAADQATPNKTIPPGGSGSASVVSPVSTAPLELASWDDIKIFTYEQRTEFAAGLKRLEEKLDGQIGELTAKRATMKNDPKEWDSAMRTLKDARAYLKSSGSEMNETSPELWSDQKEKIQRAWQSTQDAVGKVKASTTS